MMLMDASWPSNSDAAVTNRTGCSGTWSGGASVTGAEFPVVNALVAIPAGYKATNLPPKTRVNNEIPHFWTKLRGKSRELTDSATAGYCCSGPLA